MLLVKDLVCTNQFAPVHIGEGRVGTILSVGKPYDGIHTTDVVRVEFAPGEIYRMKEHEFERIRQNRE